MCDARHALHRAMWRLAILVLVGCGTSSSPSAPPPPTPAPTPTPAPSPPAIDAAPVAIDWPDGCFTYRDRAGTTHESDAKRCSERRRPFSTFKVPNALIGVELGLL